jgi:hypothetical protein
MKASEFKKMLKPLIKEAVKEVILEEGVLSKIVSEVAQGMGAPVIVEAKKPKMSQVDIREKEHLLEMQRQERIKKLNESTGLNSKIFEGLRDIPQESSGQGALSGVSPKDKGVDISGIMNIASGKWKTLAGN